MSGRIEYIPGPDGEEMQIPRDPELIALSARVVAADAQIVALQKALAETQERAAGARVRLGMDPAAREGVVAARESLATALSASTNASNAVAGEIAALRAALPGMAAAIASALLTAVQAIPAPVGGPVTVTAELKAPPRPPRTARWTDADGEHEITIDGGT